jgi:hypothetical protein
VAAGRLQARDHRLVDGELDRKTRGNVFKTDGYRGITVRTYRGVSYSVVTACWRVSILYSYICTCRGAVHHCVHTFTLSAAFNCNSTACRPFQSDLIPRVKVTLSLVTQPRGPT